MQPSERMVRANGLEHHVITWEPAAAPHPGTVLLAHGFLDVGWSWRQVAERLAAAGFRTVAFDWRGHGESEWIGPGGYYYFADYVADLSGLIPQVVDGPLHLVGHSMGGTASLLFAGAFPDRVHKLVLMEGTGPDAPKPQTSPERIAHWVHSIERVQRNQPRKLASLEEALQRMRIQNPELPDDLGLELAARSTRPTDGGFTWSFDPLHRTRGPYPFRTEALLEHARAIRCPTLLIEGERGMKAKDQEERRNAITNAQLEVIPDTGHMMHWFAPDQVARAILRFL